MNGIQASVGRSLDRHNVIQKRTCKARRKSYTISEANRVSRCFEVWKPIAQCHPDVRTKHEVVAAVSSGCGPLAGWTRYENAAERTNRRTSYNKRARAREPPYPDSE
jgi:hypothetical protein